MNQKSVIVVVLVAIMAIFLGILAFGEKTETTQLGEPTMIEDGRSINNEIENGSQVEEGGAMPQGKIDVRVACQSALMYTTFTDGVAADAFVEECVEGKHPEVIERYISEMGVDGATI